YVVGRTGTGKTTLLHNLALDWAASGHGLALVDPHGDLALDVLASLPPERADDVVVFDPTDVQWPIGLNLIEHDRSFPEQKSLLVNELLRILESLYDMRHVAGPIFEHYFRNGLLALMDDADGPGADLTLLSRFFTDSAFRRAVVRRCKNPLVRRFWLDE